MSLWGRKGPIVAAPARIVHSESQERAKAELRTVREQRFTIDPDLLDSDNREQWLDIMFRAFEYVTEVRVVQAHEDPTLFDDGRVVVVVRGVPRDDEKPPRSRRTEGAAHAPHTRV